MGNQEIIRLLKIRTDDVLSYILKARERIIFAKPAFLFAEIDTLLKLKDKFNHMDIDLYMEPGDKAIRLGFGETAALELINKNLDCFKIQLAERIRMAILCVDNTALLYAPNLSFAEQETPKLTFANGILCNEFVSNEIIKQFPVLNSDESSGRKTRSNVVILPGGYIPDETMDRLQDSITSTIESLVANPAVDPSQLQKISIYRNKYKIIQQKISGINIENKKINLNRFYQLLPDKVDRLHSSWTIFRREDIDALQDTKSFQRELKKLEGKYADSLIDAGRFGRILDVNKKAQYLEDITKLRDDFKAYCGAEPSTDIINRFDVKGKTDNKKSLEEILDDSRKELEEYLESLCPETDEFINIIFNRYRHLKSHHKSAKEIIKEFVHIFVLDELKFTDVNDIINTIDIKIDFYDISDELLNDDEFKRFLEKNELDPRQTSLGFEHVQ
jgi:hypothetical protein